MQKQPLIRYLKLTVLIAILPIATLASAAPKDRFPIDLNKLEAKAEERFKSMDANGNGEIDSTEFENAKLERRAKRGKMNRPPRHASGPRRSNPDRQANRAAMKAAVQAELFTLLDTNEDGQLSATEHAAQNREISKLAHRKARFKKMDVNGDGVLVPDEIPGRGERLRAADTDGDGKVTRQEMRAMRDSRAG